MAKKNSYDDNLFFLSEKVRILTDCLDLDIEPEIFLDNTVEEVLFIEKAFADIYASLLENTLLLDRSNHLHLLMRAKGRFAHLLESLAGGKLQFSTYLKPFAEQFKRSTQSQRADVDDIRNLLTQGDEEDLVDTAVVSEEEFKYLLMEEESGEEAP